MKKLYTLVLLVLVALTSQAQVVISQVYGGGGNSGATYNKDFVELFNRGTSAVDISGWSIQYQSATNVTTAWNFNVIPASTIIQPGKYFLIAFGAASTTNGIALPTIDFDYVSGTPAPLAMSASSGRVALVNTNTALPMGCNAGNTNIVDLVGFGPTTVCSETSPTATVLSATLSAQRLNNGCTDSNNNSSDFNIALPAPRNSSTTAYSCTAPSLSLLSPANSTIFNPLTTSVDISFTINNFVVGNPGAGIDGHIHYTVNGGSVVMKYDTTPIAIPVTAGTSYTVAIQLVNNSHQPLSPAVGVTVTFTVDSFVTVADLAALRAHVTANGAGKYYQVSSNPVVTYTRATRNQKYVQDNSGGILIDDNVTAPGVITTTVNVGDAIAGLKGQASLFNGFLQLLPLADVTIASYGNTITPQVVTIAQLNSAVTAATYESELVQINGVTFDTTTANFPLSTDAAANINLTIGSDVLTFRTAFSEANYMGTAKPTSATNIIALVGRFNATAQVTSRNLTDLNAPLSSSSFDNINGLTMYPNPLSGNTLYLTSTANAAMSVQIFDLLGKEVLKANVVNNAVNVSGLNAGVYMVKVTEEGKTATRKLVIQ
jgi:hypothetical protein